MEYINNNSKRLMISHLADNDGMGSVILAKMYYQNDIDIILAQFWELKKALDEIKDKEYNEIFICDLRLDQEILNLIENTDLKDKVKFFDHHKIDLDYSKCKWATIVPERNGFKPSGTSLFYEYLLSITNNPLITNNQTAEFVEAIRNYDTNGPINLQGNRMGLDLTSMISTIGPINFIKRYYERLLEPNDHFKITKYDQELIDIKNEEVSRYIKECDDKLIIAELLGKRIGISVSDSHRSAVGNALSQIHNELDLILIVDFIRRSFSTRTIKDVDLNEFCKQLGGGGQPKAAGFPMNGENLDMVYKLIRKEFK